MPDDHRDRRRKPLDKSPERAGPRRPTLPLAARGNHRVAQVLQRSVEIGGETYGPGRIKDVLGLLQAAGVSGKEVNGYLLNRWLVDPDKKHGPFADARELQAALVAATAAGRAAEKKGEDLEAEAAAYIGGEIAVGPSGQDEIVKTTSKEPGKEHRHVKLDVKSDAVLGIVGGAAKAGNLEKFRGICRDLRDIAAEHGKRPMVFAAGDTPAPVLDAAEAIVGAANVMVRVDPNHWVPLAEFRATAPAGAGAGAGAGASSSSGSV
jgi:hypothetical protein